MKETEREHIAHIRKLREETFKRQNTRKVEETRHLGTVRDTRNTDIQRI